MVDFTKDLAKKIISNEIGMETLLRQYPEYKKEILSELSALRNGGEPNIIETILKKYTTNAKIANSKIIKSGFNERTIKTFLPVMIKARFAIYLLEQLSVAAASENANNHIRFNLWDGTILQKLLFRKGFERKPVSLGMFKFCWRFVIHKKILMPLVNKKGIYCFYSKTQLKRFLISSGTKSVLK